MPRIGVDPVTRFPWIELPDRHGGRFASVLPLTKVQVERYNWSGQAARDGLQAAELEDCCCQLRDKYYQFSAQMVNDGGQVRLTQFMRRQPVGLGPAVALLATNLPFTPLDWRGEDPRQTMPLERTPAWCVLRWLGARQGQMLPTCAEYGELGTFALPRTDYLEAVLQQEKRLHLDRVAVRILRCLRDDAHFGRRGLPFAGKGIWELASDCRVTFYFSGRGAQCRPRPAAVGCAPFLPSFFERNCDGDHSTVEARGITLEQHPLIGFRPMIMEANLDRNAIVGV